MLSDELKELKRRERHRTNAETRYWCDQYRLFAERAVAEAAVKDAMGGEPVAVVDASDDGWFASILPDTSVKLGQLLYTRPQASAAVPEGRVWCQALGRDDFKFTEGWNACRAAFGASLLAACQPEVGE